MKIGAEDIDRKRSLRIDLYIQGRQTFIPIMEMADAPCFPKS
jgi:hypothetical protein